MAARFNVLLLAVLACAAFGFAAAQTGVKLPGTKEDTRGADGALCAGPPAKFRYQWAHELKDPSPATIAQVDSNIKAWMKLCTTKEGGSVLRYNQGPTKAKSPADYGYKGAVPDTVSLAHYGHWSDWSSMEDLQACYDIGRKAGLVGKSRGLAKNTYRVVYSLDNLKGNPKAGCMSAASNAPAKIRFMTFYTLKDASPAGSKMASDLYYKALVRNWVRTASGPDVVDDMDIEKLYGAGIKRTANFGGFIDFKSIPEMTAQFLDPASAADTAKLRALPVTSVRFAMEL